MGIAVVSLAQEKPKITGQDLLSVFSVTKVKGTELSLSPDIPDEYGKMQKGKGMLWQIPTMGVSGERVSKTITDGFVWTPRAINLGKIDLTVEGKITDLKDFDWESFKNADEVIAFANGYGVNLFGDKIKAGAISSPGLGCYLTDDGRRLPARLITETKTAGRTTLEERILEAAKKESRESQIKVKNASFSGNVVAEVTGYGEIKDEKGVTVAKGNLVVVEGWIALPCPKDAKFQHLPKLDTDCKTTSRWPKDPGGKLSSVTLTAQQDWVIRDGNFFFLVDASYGLVVDFASSFARETNISIPYTTELKLWGNKISVGENGGEISVVHARIVAGKNITVTAPDGKVSVYK